jgi:hypothetical protein
VEWSAYPRENVRMGGTRMLLRLLTKSSGEVVMIKRNEIPASVRRRKPIAIAKIIPPVVTSGWIKPICAEKNTGPEDTLEKKLSSTITMIRSGEIRVSARKNFKPDRDVNARMTSKRNTVINAGSDVNRSAITLTVRTTRSFVRGSRR